MIPNSKKDIRSLTRKELQSFFETIGEKAYRGDQVFDWLWKKGAHRFDDMTNISKPIRELLADRYTINHAELKMMQSSQDGTIKNAIQLHDGLVVESVLIPTENRTTACVSSQVGCSLNCKFCATARLKRMRNLNPDEIYDQVVAIEKQSQQYHQRPLSNIVFMGMGEPLMNYNNVLEAIQKITSEQGLGMAPRRITVSTSGIPKMIKKLADDAVKFHLAISLHAAIDQVRTKIMPFTEIFPLSQIEDAVKYWYKKTKRKVTYEYVIWKGINDRPKDIHALLDFCHIVPCKVNLIEYNSIDDPNFVQADDAVVQDYMKVLTKNKITVNLRRSRGKDIDAACGQLANK